MPTPPERSDHSQPPSRLRDRAYITEVKFLVGQWRHTAEVAGLTRQLNPENPEDAAALADPRHHGYVQAVAVIAATLADAPSLEALIRHYYDNPSPYGFADSFEAPSRKRRAKKGPKMADERMTFRDLLVETCARYSPDDRPLVQHVVLATAYYRRATQLLSGWWTGGAQPTQAETPIAPAQQTAEASTTPTSPADEPPRRRSSRQKRVSLATETEEMTEKDGTAAVAPTDPNTSPPEPSEPSQPSERPGRGRRSGAPRRTQPATQSKPPDRHDIPKSRPKEAKGKPKGRQARP